MKKGRKIGFVLNANNEESLLERAGKKEFEATYSNFLQLVAQVLDKAIQGDDCWLNIGMTKDRSGLLIVRHWEDDVVYLVAGSLASLSVECGAEIEF